MQTCPSLYCKCENKALKSHWGTRDVGRGFLPSMQSKTTYQHTRTHMQASCQIPPAGGDPTLRKHNWTSFWLLYPVSRKNKANGAFRDTHVCWGESVWLTPMLPSPSVPGSVVRLPCQTSVSVRLSSANTFLCLLSFSSGPFTTLSNPQLKLSTTVLNSSPYMSYSYSLSLMGTFIVNCEVVFNNCLEKLKLKLHISKISLITQPISIFCTFSINLNSVLHYNACCIVLAHFVVVL